MDHRNELEQKELDDKKCQRLVAEITTAADQLLSAPSFAKPGKLTQLLDFCRRLMLANGGMAELEALAEKLESAGIYEGTDWAQPEILQPSLTCFSFKSPDATTVVIESLSELRLLAVVSGRYTHPQISIEQAHHFLTQVLALNLAMLFTPLSEAERESQGRLAKIPRALLNYLAERIGFEHIIDKLIDEIWRILRQRPVQVDSVKQMITQIAICRASSDLFGTQSQLQPIANGESIMQGADRLVSSLFGPTQVCREDPGTEEYRQRLSTLDGNSLQSEAYGFTRSMHDTGLVSPYHAVYLRFIADQYPHLLADGLGLSGTGRDSLLCYHELVRALIEQGVTEHTPQSVLGLSLILERGILYQPAVAPSLWRQLRLPLSTRSVDRINTLTGTAVSPSVRLLEGVLLTLGLPLGIGQGNNPTCQSARAMSIWSYIDPDYLLSLIASAARDDEIVMHFEGHTISSRPVYEQLLRPLPLDLDAVSTLLVPHLDYIYAQMGQLCANRTGDPHRWINPEFHGWHVNRGFCINVDVTSGQIVHLKDFLTRFYAYYHPYYNGNQPLIHPQPAGIAITDSAARFIGWHAITIQRVALDPNQQMRVYFYNPNNDSGQDWGNGVVISTADNGEYYGEASLPFEQFASRIYIFHYDPQESSGSAQVPTAELEVIEGMIYSSWGKERQA